MCCFHIAAQREHWNEIVLAYCWFSVSYFSRIANADSGLFVRRTTSDLLLKTEAEKRVTTEHFIVLQKSRKKLLKWNYKKF